MKKFLIIIIIFLVGLAAAGFWAFKFAQENPGSVVETALQLVKDRPELITQDALVQGELPVFVDILQKIFVTDGVVRRYLVLMQNNMELRPGGGFLGQYAIVEIKDAQILSWEIADANHLDRDLVSDTLAPEPIAQWLDIPKLEFRDSNWAFDFPTNAKLAQHLHNLGPNPKDFDGVMAFNANILEDLLEVTGPIVVPGYEKQGQFTPEDVLIQLQDVVERPYLLAEMRDKCKKREEETGIEEECNTDPETGEKIKKVSHADRENRKDILPILTTEISKKLFGTSQMPLKERLDLAKASITSLIGIGVVNLDDRDIQMWFDDAALQEIAQSNNWSTIVDTLWDGDYVAVVDANLGALKSDYYIQRSLEYTVDFTGSNAQVNDVAAGRMVRYRDQAIGSQVLAGSYKTDLPLATMKMSYAHTAQEANYRTSDYHAYTRLYVPQGSVWKVREWFGVPDAVENVYGNKQYYGYKFDIFIGDTLPTMLQYTLPPKITEDGYALKIQKQSGVQVLPTIVKIIDSEGQTYETSFELTRDAIVRLEGGQLVVEKL